MRELGPVGMEREFNLLGSLPRCVRNVAARSKSKEESRKAALGFGKEYFDGTREQGFGGYHYDGRWVAIAKRAIGHWRLKPGDRVLDIGCAKGFFVRDLRAEMPGLDAIGIDVSDYAIENAHPEAKPHLLNASCESLPFPDNYFAAAFAINTVHNLDREGCLRSLREIERVCPGRGFVQVDAYRTEQERALFLDWMLTAKTFDTPRGWERMFAAANYRGHYWWTILEADDSVLT
jgi:SAM-dependent methyltransferase